MRCCRGSISNLTIATSPDPWAFRLPQPAVLQGLRWAENTIKYLIEQMAGTARSAPSPPCGSDGGTNSGSLLNNNGRKRPAQEDDEGEKPLALSTLLAALKENREEIVAQVREDVDVLSHRVVAAEQTVASHVTQTMQLLEAMAESLSRWKPP